jgi:hypothetical protein
MPYENIEAELNDTDMDHIHELLFQLNGLLPFLVNLTLHERKQRGAYTRRKDAFVQKAMEIAKDNPSLLPPNFDLVAWQKDISLIEKLSSLHRQIKQLEEGLSDTIIALRTETAKTSSTYYNLLLIMKKLNTPGVDAMVKSLKEAI